MSTDYRASCFELVALLECFGSTFNIPIEAPVVTRVRAELAKPEPVALTDEELARRFRVWWHDEGSELPLLPGMDHEEHTRIISEIAWANGAHVARHGTPTIQPVSVSERLPEPEDCDAEGRCWWWHPAHIEDDFDNDWVLLNHEWAGLVLRDSDNSPIYTHWLPANDLPTPEATND